MKKIAAWIDEICKNVADPDAVAPRIRAEIAEFCKQDLNTLWAETRRLTNPHKVYVDLSDKLFKIKAELLEKMSDGKLDN